MNTTPASPRPASPRPASPRPASPRRALVLGGGGSTGNAWLIGVVAGLLDGGLDVSDADLTVGTSAGATAAAQLGGATASELLDAVLTGAPQPGVGGGSRPARAGRAPVADHLARMRAVIEAADDLADLRRRMGAAALEAEASSDASRQLAWRTTVAARLPRQDWPVRTVLITAVDARTGEPVIFDRHSAFDRHSGVDLVDAVAASCSSGFAYRIGDRSYVDGGYRTNAENADLAAGHERVLVLSPLGGRSLHPPEWGTHLSAQVEELRAQGSRVETIVPDSSEEHLFGVNAMDVSLRPAAARAGHHQGKALAPRIGVLWG